LQPDQLQQKREAQWRHLNDVTTALGKRLIAMSNPGLKLAR
jgi:hypothetical protein